ncbi:copper-binding protein [Halopseudomonas pelagia]|uniref:copper-binding protein n=1 Tax=Halopseudomonas pelagia TaxID=553151 RepID=UPI0030DBA09E|tara:strand:+ start:465 stop:692 length:228 start_codon:yes stop_codon:yes gene_type:complete
MGHNAMSQSASDSMASCTVKKMNLESGMMVIAHGPVEALGWPPMTMSFKASPDLMRDLKEGDAVMHGFRRIFINR